MFRHEGPSRSLRKNVIVAGYLAFVAGFVNSGGFVMIGTFTSHVTGSVGRIGTDLAAGELAAAVLALLMVISFFAGAFGATLIIEGHPPVEVSRAYGRALFIEGGLLGFFVFVAGLSQATHPRLRDAEAVVLCLAMGMQNSLVTRLSGSVVRTTHLTGVLTDLAIEGARWYRWLLGGSKDAERPQEKTAARWYRWLLGGPQRGERPQEQRAALLGTIVGMFVLGALVGAVLTLRASRWAMVLPAIAVTAAAAQAYFARDESASA